MRDRFRVIFFEEKSLLSHFVLEHVTFESLFCFGNNHFRVTCFEGKLLLSHFVFKRIVFEKPGAGFGLGLSRATSKVGVGRVRAVGLTAGRWECQGGGGVRLQLGVSGLWG